MFDMMVDEREGGVAAALSRLARRYFSPKYPNISIWVFEYFHPNISIWVFLLKLPIFEK